MAAVAINQEDCIGCGACVEACPNEVLALNDDLAVVEKGEDCIGCGICADECPVDAVTVVA